MQEQQLELASQWLQQADSILLSAGAGMGVDSGLPDFRGNAGFWRAHPCYQAQGLGFADMANPAWFEHDIARAWGFYGYRFQRYQHTQPHRGFAILRQWLAQKNHFVFTSNVDGQFQKAGFSPQRIVECHGSIHYLQCASASNPCAHIWALESLDLQIDEQTMTATGNYPQCPHCGALARPNILMFSDAAWLSDRQDRQQQRYQQWSDAVQRQRTVVIEIGAGTAVPTVRHESAYFGAKLLRINPERPAPKRAEVIHLSATALTALEALEQRL